MSIDWLGAAIAGVPLLTVSLLVQLDIKRRQRQEASRWKR